MDCEPARPSGYRNDMVSRTMQIRAAFPDQISTLPQAPPTDPSEQLSDCWARVCEARVTSLAALSEPRSLRRSE